MHLPARLADIEPTSADVLLAAIYKTGQDELVREASDLQELRVRYAADLDAFDQSQAALAVAGRQGSNLSEGELECVHQSGETLMVTIRARQEEIFQRSSALISHYAEDSGQATWSQLKKEENKECSSKESPVQS